jgi:hypothetical protein
MLALRLKCSQHLMQDSVCVVPAAGRWDLHNAMTRHGGYMAVAAELERRQHRTLPEELMTKQESALASSGSWVLCLHQTSLIAL